MIKWNKVTWYSRLGAIILFIGVVPVLTFYVGVQYQLTLSSQQLQTPHSSAQPTASKSVLPSSSRKNEGTDSYSSPNGEYTAMTYSNEDGAIETYILDKQGNKITPLYCGAFDSWSPDSSKIKVYIQSECGYTTNEQYYYLTITGTRQTLEGADFTPTTR
jgi:hypothetical protein